MKNILKRIITGISLASAFLGSYFYLPPIFLSLMLAAIMFEIIIVEMPRLFDYKEKNFWLLLPFYPTLPFALLIYLNQASIYHQLILVLILTVALFDTGSFIAGKLFGRSKIAPTISPGKTWEGAFGGFILSIASLHVILRLHSAPHSLLQLLAISLCICTLSLYGDLFASYLKRRAGIKDTGFLLPGHGGLLDRFDGILFATIFFFLFRNSLIALLQ